MQGFHTATPIPRSRGGRDDDEQGRLTNPVRRINRVDSEYTSIHSVLVIVLESDGPFR